MPTKKKSLPTKSEPSSMVVSLGYENFIIQPQDISKFMEIMSRAENLDRHDEDGYHDRHVSGSIKMETTFISQDRHRKMFMSGLLAIPLKDTPDETYELPTEGSN